MRLALSSTMVVIRLSCKSRSRGCRVHKPGGSVGCVGLRARSTFYPCRHVRRTPYASCPVERVAANPLHTSAPSLNDGECLTHPVRERAPGPVVYVVNSLSVAAVSLRCWRLRFLSFQLCALRQHSVLDVAPQCDQQSARQGHDADAPHYPTAFTLTPKFAATTVVVSSSTISAGPAMHAPGLRSARRNIPAVTYSPDSTS